MLHDQKGAKFGHNFPCSYVVDEKMKLFQSLRPKQKARFNKMTQTMRNRQKITIVTKSFKSRCFVKDDVLQQYLV